jgi:D-inositol-3-phosphate glycosyltransferase
MRPKTINSQKNRKIGRLLFVGRDSKEKRVTLAIQIANVLHSRGLDTSLVLAGVEKDSRSLRDARNGVVVDARGWLDQTSVSELIDSSWSLLVTSEYEALPMCVIEAMSSGLPVIGSEAIEGLFSNSGIIVNSNDPEIWALRISELLEDHDKWQSLSKSGPRESTIFDADRVRESWLRLYNSIIMQTNDL